MRLYKDKTLLNQTIAATARYFKVDPVVVEKDYYTFVFLRRLAKQLPGLLLYGNVSLLKCHKITNLFSEDINLTLAQYPVSKGQRKQVKKTITGVCNDLHFVLLNEDEIRSRRDFNRYEINYSPKRSALAQKPVLLVETSYAVRTYPIEIKPAASMIYDYMLAAGQNDFIRQYKLQPFHISVQSMSRTLIDKIFALCDYYLTDRTAGHSRHIYEISRLLDCVPLDTDFISLFHSVRISRKLSDTPCVSANDEYSIPSLLEEILDKEVYKTDYTKITSGILFHDVSYDEAVLGIQKLIECGLLDT